MTMTLRKADLSDVDVIVELWKGMMELHQRSDDYYVMDTDAENAYRMYARENIENGGKLFNVCLADNDDIVGYVLADVYEHPPIYPVRKYMEIIEMAVREDQRRKGFGEFMLEDVLRRARAEGLTRVECKVVIRNEISRNFWKKNGFRAYLENLVLDMTPDRSR